MREDPAQRVVDRVRCLYARFLRAHVEAARAKRKHGLGISVPMSVDQQLELCRSVLSDPELSAALTGEERAALLAKPGKLRAMDIRAGLYCADAIDVLVEALGGIDMQPAGKLPYCVTLPKCAPAAFLGPALAPWLARPRLLPRPRLRRIFLINEAYAWRLRLHTLTLSWAFRDAHETGLDLDEAIRQEAEYENQRDAFIDKVVGKRAAQCRSRGLFKPVRGDFPIGRTTFKQYTERTLHFSEHENQVVTQRLRAAAWLLRPETSWLRTRAPTRIGFTIPAKLRGPAPARFIKRCFDPEVNLTSFRSAR